MKKLKGSFPISYVDECRKERQAEEKQTMANGNNYFDNTSILQKISHLIF